MGASSSKNIQTLEKKIGYRFKRKTLILEALTHKSYAKEQHGSHLSYNERMEFLGDAVLGLILSKHLFRTYPGYSESELSKIRAYAARKATLAEVSKNLDLGSHLFLGRGEEASGGRNKSSLLANTFESVLAAVYLDGGFKNASEFTLRHLDDKISSLIRKDLLFDFKTSYQEAVQEHFGVLPKYTVSREEGPDHMKTFEVRVHVKEKLQGVGRGKSKKEAEQKAARAGMKKLKII